MKGDKGVEIRKKCADCFLLVSPWQVKLQIRQNRLADVFVVPDAVNIPYANKGDILITSANGSTRLVGKHAIIMDIPDNSAVHGGFMLLASAKNSEFVNALMSAPWYSKFISLYVAGGNGAIGNLNKNDLDEQDVFVPEDAEQKAIGQYFAQLDELITLHQRERENTDFGRKET